MKCASTINCTNTSIIYLQNGNADSVKALDRTLSSCDDRKVAEIFGQRGYKWAILADLSKAFDCTLHNLLIAKLVAYGFDCQSLRIMESFLSNRHQRT